VLTGRNTMRIHVVSLAVVLLATIFPWVHVAADDGSNAWEPIEQSDGVTSWKLAGRSGPGAVLKGEVELAVGIEAVRRILEDTPNHTKWMHKCVESTELRRTSDSEAILYNRTHSPWPVKDRDVVYRLTRATDDSTGDLIFKFAEIRSDLKPVVDGVVRMPKMSGYWRLTKLGASRTKVLYYLETDVGGSVPGWAVKSVLERIPYETLRGLRGRLATR
ncbi:MAG TPA: START domain-containing protein, partial [Polyangiales bacterium]